MLAKVDLSIVDPLDTSSFQISLYQTTQMVCVITGQNTYKYLKLEDNMRAFKETHSQLVPHGRDNISTDYTAHCWAKDLVQLIVATANGDILVCAMSGEFLIYIPGSPQGHRIDCLVPYSRGFIATGQDGYIWPFEQSQLENVVYRPQQ